MSTANTTAGKTAHELSTHDGDIYCSCGKNFGYSSGPAIAHKRNANAAANLQALASFNACDGTGEIRKLRVEDGILTISGICEVFHLEREEIAPLEEGEEKIVMVKAYWDGREVASTWNVDPEVFMAKNSTGAVTREDVNEYVSLAQVICSVV